MPSTQERSAVGELLAPDIAELLDARQAPEARKILVDLQDPEVADVLMALSPRHRVLAFRLLPRDKAADIFTFLPADQQEQLLSELGSEQMVQILNEMDPDDRADVFEELPGQLAAKLLEMMRPEERRSTQIILGYPPQSVGRLMTPDYVAIDPTWTVQQTLDYVRAHGRDAETLDTLLVVDGKHRLLDDVRLRQVLLADPAAPVRSLLDGQVTSLHANDDQEEAVRVMQRYDRPVLPVVDRDNVLVGIVTFDDVADVATEEVTEDVQKMGGMEALDEPYTSTSLLRLVRKRGTWLSALFLGEMLTATAMSYYQAEIEHASVLALFLPLIISSGGNSGSQASTLIIRAMAVRELHLRDWWRVLMRELSCGLLLGLLLGVLGVIRIHVWEWLGWGQYAGHYHLIGATVGTALIGVVLWGTLMGSMLPFLLRALKLDPAAISAPLVATLVDVTGLVIYFTTAMLILRGTLL